VRRPEGERKPEAPRVARVETFRRALKLSHEEFAGSFHIPIGTLRVWGQGRKALEAAR
jgi:DNA-binding transcriptional regulator YiaG